MRPHPTDELLDGASRLQKGVRRCPTLPHPPGCSTIGAVGLSFRVRNGTGRFPHAMTAVTLLPEPRRGLGSLVVTTSLPVGRGWCCIQLLGSANRVVGWEPHSEREQSLLFIRGVCGVSYRLISTGQLHESLVLASTSGLSTQWSSWGPLTQ